MELVAEAVRSGLTKQEVCRVLGLSERRFRIWQARARRGDYARHKKAPEVRPYNALRPEEETLIQRAVARGEWTDLSCRELSVRIMETEEVYVSHLAIWQYEKRMGLAGHRGKRRGMGRPRGEAPDTSWVSGPNQLWAWDITKLRTGVPYQFWYLYVVLDQWSRKVVGWLVSDRQTSAESQRTWDMALLAEALKDGPMPTSLSDRGTQMRARTTREFFQDLGVGQLFSRPRTPNDNPYVESFFATVKTAPAYPGWFTSVEDAVSYFERFFAWYNGEHLHTRIDMVTPKSKHDGSWVEILAKREEIKVRTFAARRAVNCPEAGQTWLFNKHLKPAIS